jgi:hypothetical protein
VMVRAEMLAFLESSALLIIRDSLISFKEFLFISLRLDPLYRGSFCHWIRLAVTTSIDKKCTLPLQRQMIM